MYAAGYFCVTGSVTYQPCPLGHYGNSTNLRRDTDCTPCPGGYYCDGIGLTTPTDVCDAGKKETLHIKKNCSLGYYTFVEIGSLIEIKTLLFFCLNSTRFA